MASFADEVRADSPSLWWRADEWDGALIDEMGGANGTSEGNLSRRAMGALADGSRAYNFGATGYATFPDDARTDTGDTFTLEVIFKRDAPIGASQYKLLSKGSDSFFLGINNTAIEIAKQGAAIIGISTTGVNVANTWYHVVWTKATTTNLIYINGVDRTGTMTNATIANSATALNIARSSTAGEYFVGAIDEVVVYVGSALSAARVLDHYTGFASGTPPHGPYSRPADFPRHYLRGR